MADTKISDMTAASDLTGAVVPIVQTTNKKAAIALFDARYVDVTNNQNVGGIKTFTNDPLIPDEAYGSGWNGVLEPPTKNAVYDQLQTMSAADWSLASGGTLTGTNTIDAGSNPLIFNTSITTQTDQSSGIRFNANTLTSGYGIYVLTTSITSGQLVRFESTSTAASDSHIVLSAVTSGANASANRTTFASNFTNTRTGTTSTNIAVRAIASGGSTNYAIYAYGAARFESAASAIGMQIAAGTITNYGGTDIVVSVTGGNLYLDTNQAARLRTSTNSQTVTIGSSNASLSAVTTLVTLSGSYSQIATGSSFSGISMGNSHTCTAGSPTSYNYAAIRVGGTYNMTTATGYVAGFYFNPTITSLGGTVSLYAIATGSGLHGFGTLTPTATVHVSQYGSAPILKIEAATLTGLTAATEFIANDFIAATWTWADGTVTTQRFNYFRGYTLNKTTTAATFTNAYNVYIDDLTAGSGVTITNKWSLGVAGNVIIVGTRVNIANLPTSAAGLATGDLWNDSGTIKIA